MDALAKQQQVSPQLNGQRYQRGSPSFSGTARTVDSGATVGHGPSATARPRDLPSPPADESHRLTSASGMAADAIVDSYGTSNDPLRASVASSHYPYDGLAEDDNENTQEREMLVVPSHITVGQEHSPNGDTIWRGSQYEDAKAGGQTLPQRSSSLSTSSMTKSDSGVGMNSTERPKMYYKGHPSQEVMAGHEQEANVESTQGGPPLPSKT